MQEFLVVAILLAVCLILIGSVIMVCKMAGIWDPAANNTRFPQSKTGSDEKSALTKAEHHQAYNTETESFGLGASTKASTGHAIYNADSEVRGDRSSPTSAEDTSSIPSDSEPTAGMQRAISCDSIDSTSSVMDLEPEAPKIGQLEFGLEYDYEAGELVVSVIQARDLEAPENTGSLDSYVKLWLSPSRQAKLQTKIIRDDPYPVYKERFLFNLEPEELPHKTVYFQVYSCDKYARQKLLGETDIKTGDIDLRNPIRVWMNLRDMDQKPTELGDIMFSLSYLPTAERLTVVIVKCRSLKWSNDRDTGDCFLKVYLLQNGKKISKKKTSTKRDCKDPIFNEAMMFSVPGSTLSSLQLRLSVVQVLADRTHSSIGHVIVGSQLSGTELTHWNQMMTSLRKPVAMWHSLRK